MTAYPRVLGKSSKQLANAPSSTENSKRVFDPSEDDSIKLHLHFRDLAKSEKNSGAGESFHHKVQGKMLEEKKIIARKTAEQFLNKVNSNQSSVDAKDTKITLK